MNKYYDFKNLDPNKLLSIKITKGQRNMKKNEILNQLYKSPEHNFTSVRIVKFYDRDDDNEICIIKDHSNLPYMFMDIKSGWVFGFRFKTLNQIRDFKKGLRFNDWLKRLNEVRHTARYQQLVSRYEEFKKIWGNR